MQGRTSPELKLNALAVSGRIKEQIMSEENKEKSKFKLWLENFIYHYKWHSIVAAVLIVIVVVSTFQMCNKPKYDVYVMYAGNADIKMTRGGADLSEYEELYTAIKRHVGDKNGDGERTLNLLNLFLPSAERIAEIEALNDGTEINYTLVRENDGSFRQNVTYGNYYICLISEHLFLEWTKEERSNPFEPITELLPDGAEYTVGAEGSGYVLPNEYGVYLSSIPLKDRAGYSLLPDDTVICFRRHIKATSKVGGIKSEVYHENCREVLKLMLADKAYE